MEFSPPKRPPKRSERSKWFEVQLPVSPEDDVQEKPTLVLKPFSAIPHISFNKVKLGCTKSCDLYIYNPLDIGQVVKVDKVPTEKGFYIESEEYSIGPGEEKIIKIFWTPEKPSSYRETIGFKTSTGCKTHAYLLGTSYLPVKKVAQKTVPVKSKRQFKKKISPKTVKKCSMLSKSSPVLDGFKFCEEKKENLDFLNSQFNTFIDKPKQTLFKSSEIDPRTSFCLKTNDEFPDSPIRRQTYTINSMLLSGRESEILPFSSNDLSNNIAVNNTWKKNKVDLSPDKNCKYQNTHKKFLHNPLLTKLSNEDNLNDSLENIKANIVNTSPDFNDSLSEIELSHGPVSFDVSYMKDCVKTYDIANKHLYFGYTPQQCVKDEKSMCLRQFEYSRKTEILPLKSVKTITSVIPNLKEKQLNISAATSNFDIDNSGFDEKIDMTNCASSDFDKDNCNLESFSLNEISYRDPISECSGFINEFSKYVKKNCHEQTYEKNCENFCTTDKVREKFITVDFENFNSQQKQDADKGIYLCEENLTKDNATSVKVLKETAAALFMEFPNDSLKVSNSTAPLKFSKTTNKQSIFPHLTSHTSRKNKKSSPLKKTGKSRSVSIIKNSSLKSLSATSKTISGTANKENLTKRLPQKLCLGKSSRVSDAAVYQRNPFASMNVYYDERWIEKQEAAFSTWLNFILTPNDDFSSEDVKVDSAKLWIESIKESSAVPAPTKEELSLKAYTATRNLNALRKASFSLYQSDDIVPVIKKIEREVDLKKINIRKDRAIHADLGIKKDILEMLLSYNPFWLRIGLETVYGEVITLQNNSDVLGLSCFIVHRFLTNPDISAKFMHPGVINYYKKGYEDEIQRFILKKFLLLVFFLDIAKNVHLIKHNPCLFNKNSKFKSSRSLLLAFSRDYLSGEGDITKHLRYLGCKVTYEQSALEEFDFSVRNLSTDLRCGLRLGRVVEILLQDWTISQNLRINTLNRLTKIHNNDVILKALKKAAIEIENNIEAKHIVDGYREKTLDLLWQIIFKTQISKLINKDLLKKENVFLNKSLKLKADFAAFNALRKPEHLSNQQEISILDSKLYKENEILRLLFQWCQSVCAHYGIKVHNFTSSFSDGRVLCLLLHHYHPNVLPYECIKFETSNSYFEKQMELAETNEDCPFFTQNGQSNALMDKLLKNERDNLALVFQKFQEVGHIPILSCPSDMSNTMPDEKVTITLVSYVNIRLMELSIEIRAARKILHAWQKYKLRKQHEKLVTEIKAVTVIQKAWKKYINKKKMEKKNNAAIKIQTFWRMYSAKEELKRIKERKNLFFLNKSAICIQALFRGHLVRKQILKKHLAATVIQSYFRRWSARTYYIKLKRTTLRIQQKFRAKVLAQAQRTWYLTSRQNFIKLQAYSRGMLIRRQVKKKLNSAVKIQAYVRMWLERKKYNNIRNACIIIQQKFKGYLLTEFYSQEYQNHRSAAISIQKWYRAIKIQQCKIKSIIKAQACVRRFIARKKYLTLKKSVTKIQVWWHAVSTGKKARLAYLQTRQSIICIQSFIRQYIASQKYRQQKKSAIVIQKYVRMFIAKRNYCRLKRTAILIQNLWRSKCLTKCMRSEFLSYRKKVILVQSVIRCHVAMRNYKIIRQAAISIQKCTRTLLLRKKFCQLKLSAICIQRKWRAIVLARVTRESYLLYRKKVIFIQSLIRKKIAYDSFKKKKHSAIIIQKNVRMLIQRKQYLNFKKSVSLIQNHWRNFLLGRQMQREFLKYKKAAIIIQSMYRMYSCRRNFVLLKKAAKTVERYRIGKIQRENYVKIKQSTIKLQSFFRGYLCKKTFLKSVRDVILIQACIRKFIIRRRYLKTRSSIVKIQRFYRSYKLKCTERQKYLKIRKGIIRFQAIYRGRCLRKHLNVLHRKATIIQSHYRKWISQSEFKLLKQNCMIIQTRYRAKLQMRQQYYNYRKLKKSAITIQAFVRGYMIRRQYLVLKMSVIKLQSYIRMVKCYRTYQKTKTAARIIEQYYKSYLEMKAVRNDYLQKRSQIIYLQSKVRSLIVRRMFLWKKRACILLQSYIRMRFQRRKYLKVCNSVIFVQRNFRNNKIAKLQKIAYIHQRQSIIYLQSKVRCMITRRKYLQQRKSIIYLQSKIRSMIARKRYLQQRQSIIFLQAKVRCIIERKRYLQQRRSIIYLQSKVRCMIARKRYLLQRQSINYLQSKLRSVIARKNYLKQKKSCIFIQAFIRMCIQQKKFRRIHNAAVFIQRHYRNQRIMKLQRSAFIQQKQSIICLQSYVRCMIERKKYLKLKNACTLIQSYIRMYLQRKQFLKVKKATICLQKQYQSWKSMKIQRSEYLLKRQCVIVLQSKFRSLLVRKRFLKKKLACIKIQSFFRMYRCRKTYLKIKNAAKTIQKYYCSWKKMKIEQNTYLKKRKAIILLQSKFRSVLERKNYLKQKKSCILIQSYCRMLSQKKKYQDMCKTIIFLQRYYRSYCLTKCYRQAFIEKRNAAIYLQSKIRCFIMRQKYLKLKDSCIVIQSYVRMVLKKTKYEKTRKATIVIQKYFRNYQFSLEMRKKFLTLCKACIIMQSYFRMYRCRKEYLKLRSATLLIQKKYRAKREADKVKQHFMLQKAACIKIQSYFRMVLAVRLFLKYRKSTIKIQSKYRSYIAQKKYIQTKSATITLQKYFIAWKIAKVARSKFLLLKQSVIKIQATVRRYICLKKFRKQRNAALTLQKYVKAHIIARKIHKQYVYRRKCIIIAQASVRGFLIRNKLRKLHISATKIQAAYRSYVVRKCYLRQKESAVIIQRYFRSVLLTRKIRQQYEKMQISAIVIQSAFRCYIKRKEFLKKKAAVITLQAYVRRFLSQTKFIKLKKSVQVIENHYLAYKTGLKEYELYNLKKRSCIKIQAVWRSYSLSKKLRKLHISATKIQAAYRSYVVRKSYLRQKESAMIIQRYFRSVLLTRKIRQEYEKMQISAIIIQSAFRCYIKRKEFLKKKAAVITLQAHVRRFLSQTKFIKLKKSIQVIENHYLAYKTGLKEYELYNLKKRSCIKIQAVWRSYSLSKKLKAQTEAAVRIQRAVRLWLQRRSCKNMKYLLQNQSNLPSELLQHLWYVYLRKSTIHFQRAARAYLLRRHKAATVIQSHFRRWRIEKLFKKLKAAVKIQACWRAYVVRRAITNKKIVEARKRIQAADSSEPNKLKNRTSRSLDLLFRDSRIASMMVALQELDACTKLSPRCCERLVASGGLTILIELVSVCNRSIPHMEIIKVTTNVLLNLAKYDKTVDYVWETEGSISTILRLMKTFREKGITIFNKCCSLLAIFCQDPAKVEIMKSRSDLTEEIRSFHYLLKRKQNFEEKQLVVRGFSGKSFLNRTVSTKANMSVLQKDSIQIEPDWMLGGNRGREFKDPVTGISWLMKILELKSKGPAN